MQRRPPELLRGLSTILSFGLLVRCGSGNSSVLDFVSFSLFTDHMEMLMKWVSITGWKYIFSGGKNSENGENIENNRKVKCVELLRNGRAVARENYAVFHNHFWTDDFFYPYGRSLW